MTRANKHPKWREKESIIYLSVTSNGMTGEEWLNYFRRRRFNCNGEWIQGMLRSFEFQPTSGITTEVAILKGELFSEAERTTTKIRTYATGLNFREPNAEVACLLRDKLSDRHLEEMGINHIVTMHKAIQFRNSPNLLATAREEGSQRRLACYYDGPDCSCYKDVGFAFVK